MVAHNFPPVIACNSESKVKTLAATLSPPDWDFEIERDGRVSLLDSQKKIRFALLTRTLSCAHPGAVVTPHRQADGRIDTLSFFAVC